jgi:hypothetical protein
MNSPKYNRTLHLPWSPGGTSDDKRAKDAGIFCDRLEIVITEKMDGSNTSLEKDGCFARTHQTAPKHESFNGLKAFHASVKYKIPKGIQLFGEWCYAKHSISYEELPGYFMLFNVRDNLNKDSGMIKPRWLSWDEVETWAKEIGVPTVPVLYRGRLTPKDDFKGLTDSLMNQPSVCGGIREGVVVRLASAFYDNVFDICIMKCVRANHVQTDEHWKDQEIIKNKLK